MDGKMAEKMSEINHNSPAEEPASNTLELLRDAAAAGDARSQFQLGMHYANGEGVPLNYVLAAEWIGRAAEQDLAQAQSVLAWLHANGFGVRQDDQMAGHWYLRAAELGLASAQYTVAAMYRWGRYGVARDSAAMLGWYQRAAEQGLGPAQYALGQILAAGREVPRDPVAAFQWLTLAILNGSEAAKQALAELSEDMEPREIERAKREITGRLSR